MNAALIEKIRHICVKSGVPETVMGAICHEVRHTPLSTTGALPIEGDITKVDDDASADAEGVRRFAIAMREKMTEKRLQGYAGWHNDCTVVHLEALLQEHIEKTWDPRNLVDIANFCMMIWNRHLPLTTASATGALPK